MKKIFVALCLAATALTASTALAAEGQASVQNKNQKLKPYTLKTCVVTGDKLGEMGDPYVYKYQDREIKFCCKGCLKDFNKEPAKYVKKIEEAEKAAKKEQATAPAQNHGAHQH